MDARGRRICCAPLCQHLHQWSVGQSGKRAFEPSSARFLVGASDDTPPDGDQFFDGQITDVRLWANPIGSDIVLDSASSNCSATADVHFPLTEGSGLTVSSTSGMVSGQLSDPSPAWAPDGPEALAWCTTADTTPPVIAADSLGPGLLIKHNENGLLVPVGDAVSLAEAIKWVTSDPALVERLRVAGEKAFRDTFAMDKVGPQYLALLKRLTNKAA